MIRVALAVAALYLLSCYVAQQRYQTIGFCPLAVLGAPSMMIFDSRDASIYCQPLPMPPAGDVRPDLHDESANPKVES